MARTPAPAPRRAAPALPVATVKQVEAFMSRMLPEEIAQPLLTLMANLIELHTVENDAAEAQDDTAEAQDDAEAQDEAPQEQPAPRRPRRGAPQPAPAGRPGRRPVAVDPDEQEEAPEDQEAPEDDEDAGLLGDGDLLTPEEDDAEAQDEAPEDEQPAPAPRRRGAAPAAAQPAARGRKPAAPAPAAEGITFEALFTKKELANIVEDYATQYANDYKVKGIKDDIVGFSTEQLGEDNVIALRGSDINVLADNAARVYAGIEKLMGLPYAEITAMLTDYDLTPAFGRNQSEKTRRKVAVAALINACLENA